MLFAHTARGRLIRSVGAVALAAATSPVLVLVQPAYASVPSPITYTDTTQVVTDPVPANVCQITFDARGGQGGTGGGDIGAGGPGGTGGAGGRVVAALTVTPGGTYKVAVGAPGANGYYDSGGAGGGVNDGSGGQSGGVASGGNGGATSTYAAAGGGGGASMVTIGTGSTPDIVAGGGGGGGDFSVGNAGDAGDPAQDGTTIGGGGTGGGGATSSGPGTAGGSPGVGHLGGNGVHVHDNDGGAGGGGWYGGGGGNAGNGGGGGGGGSNHAPGGATTDGVASSGFSQVTATFSACTGVPQAPTGLTATPGNTTAQLSFTPGGDGSNPVTSYQASVDGGSTWTTLTTTVSGATLTAPLTGLTNGTLYTVRVRGVSSSGNGATASTTVTPAAQAPAAPTGLTVTSGNTTLALSFTPGNNGGATVDTWSYSTDAGSTWHTFTPVPGASGSQTYTINSLTNGTTYQVQVRAHNSVGDGTATASVPGTPATVPDAPTSLTTAALNTGAKITFTPPVGNGGSVITSYEVSTDNGTTWATITTSPAGSDRSGTVTGLTNGTVYQVKVRARNAIGAGTASTASSVTPALTAPNAPTSLTVAPANTAATLTFTAPTDNGGSPITSYQASSDNGSTWATITTTVSGASLTGTLTGLTNGTVYQIKVRAVNAIGSGPAAGPASVTPAITAPAAPTGVTLTPGDGTLAFVYTPGDNGGATVDTWGYSTDNGSTWTLFTPVSQSFTIPALTNGTAYPVRVRAHNSVGYGPGSTAVTGTPVAAPAAPTALSASAGNTTAAITFTPGSANGSPITSYEVSTDNGTTWATISTVPAGSNRTASVTGLTNGTAYQIKVRAVNAFGTSAASTATSVTPTATAPGAPTALTAAARNASTLVTFTPPTDTGGSPITSYEVSVDNGTTWVALTTATGTGGTLTGTATGLTNGTAYQVKVRARNTIGAGPATSAATVTPLAPPTAPGGVTAVGGTSSITVTWTAATTAGAPITGYTATANPGPATCTTTTALTCVLGGVAGQTYTVTVVANSASGDSAAAGPSTAATVSSPTPPATVPDTPLNLTTDKGRITTAEPGQQIVVIGTGFAAHSTAEITVYSNPTVLATVTTDGSGNFSQPVTVPASLASGAHTVLAQGAAPDGTLRSMKLAITVASSSSDLPVTGFPVAPAVVLATLMLLCGVVLTTAGRRRVRAF